MRALAVVALVVSLPAFVSAMDLPSPVFHAVPSGDADADGHRARFQCAGGELRVATIFGANAVVVAHTHVHWRTVEAECATAPGEIPTSMVTTMTTVEGDVLRVTWLDNASPLAPATGGGVFRTWTLRAYAADDGHVL